MMVLALEHNPLRQLVFFFEGGRGWLIMMYPMWRRFRVSESYQTH